MFSFLCELMSPGMLTAHLPTWKKKLQLHFWIIQQPMTLGRDENIDVIAFVDRSLNPTTPLQREPPLILPYILSSKSFSP